MTVDLLLLTHHSAPSSPNSQLYFPASSYLLSYCDFSPLGSEMVSGELTSMPHSARLLCVSGLDEWRQVNEGPEDKCSSHSFNTPVFSSSYFPLSTRCPFLWYGHPSRSTISTGHPLFWVPSWVWLRIMASFLLVTRRIMGPYAAG